MKTETSRRHLLKRIGLGGLGLAAVGPLASTSAAALSNSDINILNFALNLEYLAAEYYTFATTGAGIEAQGIKTSGSGTKGNVIIKPNPLVPFVNPALYDYALELAADERAHIKLLRSTINEAGRVPAARPKLNLKGAFNAFAEAAGVIEVGGTFDPFSDEGAFLLGAFIFEDMGATFYRQAVSQLTNTSVLSNIAGLLGTEAYHASNIRVQLFQIGGVAIDAAQLISDYEDALDGDTDISQGLVLDGRANIVPATPRGLIFSRSQRQVLNIVYAQPGATEGGFYPNGFNP